jgi:hypothetical protein
VARARRRDRTVVSLFPFLSVLACVIGALTLLITATAIGQIVAGDAIDLERYERLEAEIATGRHQLAALTALEEEVGDLERMLAAARSEQEQLEAEGARVRDALERSAPLREELRAAEARVAALESELSAVDARVGARRTELDEQAKARAAVPILIKPSGTGYGLDPQFAECTEEGLVLYEGVERRPTHVYTHRIATSAEYRRFLRRVRMRPGTTVVFLIRPGGVPVYDRASHEATRSGVRHGKIAIHAEGKLDFSVMDAS